MGRDRKLPPKQVLFVKEYLVDFVGAQAAIRAGYAPKNARITAAKLLTSPNIQAAVKEETDKRAARIEISQDWVLKRLKRVAKRCLEDIPVTDREGNEIGVYKFEAAGANKALELIGKHLKMFTDKVEHGVSQELADIYARVNGTTRGLPSRRTAIEAETEENE